MYLNGKIKSFINKKLFGVWAFWLTTRSALFTQWRVCWTSGSVGIIFFYSFNCFIIIVYLLLFSHLHFFFVFFFLFIWPGKYLCLWVGVGVVVHGGSVTDHDLYGQLYRSASRSITERSSMRLHLWPYCMTVIVVCPWENICIFISFASEQTCIG